MAAPTMTRLSPDWAPPMGGTTFKVIGTGFEPHNIILAQIDTVATTCTYNSATELTCKAPESVRGAATNLPFQLEIDNQVVSQSNIKFRYVSPIVHEFDEQYVTPGQRFTVIGEYFFGLPPINGLIIGTFGTTPLIEFRCVFESVNTIVCTMPATFGFKLNKFYLADLVPNMLVFYVETARIQPTAKIALFKPFITQIRKSNAVGQTREVRFIGPMLPKNEIADLSRFQVFMQSGNTIPCTHIMIEDDQKANNMLTCTFEFPPNTIFPVILKPIVLLNGQPLPIGQQNTDGFIPLPNNEQLTLRYEALDIKIEPSSQWQGQDIAISVADINSIGHFKVGASPWFSLKPNMIKNGKIYITMPTTTFPYIDFQLRYKAPPQAETNIVRVPVLNTQLTLSHTQGLASGGYTVTATFGSMPGPQDLAIKYYIDDKDTDSVNLFMTRNSATSNVYTIPAANDFDFKGRASAQYKVFIRYNSQLFESSATFAYTWPWIGQALPANPLTLANFELVGTGFTSTSLVVITYNWRGAIQTIRPPFILNSDTSIMVTTPEFNTDELDSVRIEVVLDNGIKSNQWLVPYVSPQVMAISPEYGRAQSSMPVTIYGFGFGTTTAGLTVELTTATTIPPTIIPCAVLNVAANTNNNIRGNQMITCIKPATNVQAQFNVLVTRNTFPSRETVTFKTHGLTCLGYKGKPVDWFLVKKLGSRSGDPKKKDDMYNGHFYVDSTMALGDQIILPERYDARDGGIAQTFMQHHNYPYIFFSDQQRKRDTPSATGTHKIDTPDNGHVKGGLMWDVSGGVVTDSIHMMHSQSSFPMLISDDGTAIPPRSTYATPDNTPNTLEWFGESMVVGNYFFCYRPNDINDAAQYFLNTDAISARYPGSHPFQTTWLPSAPPSALSHLLTSVTSHTVTRYGVTKMNEISAGCLANSWRTDLNNYCYFSRTVFNNNLGTTTTYFSKTRINYVINTAITTPATLLPQSLYSRFVIMTNKNTVSTGTHAPKSDDTRFGGIDIWEVMANSLGRTMFVQTWIKLQGSRRMLGANGIINVEIIGIPDRARISGDTNIKLSTGQQDHTKMAWSAFPADNGPKVGQDNMFCFGDSNRHNKQGRRGAGAFCFQNEMLVKMFHSFVLTYTSFVDYNEIPDQLPMVSTNMNNAIQFMDGGAPVQMRLPGGALTPIYITNRNPTKTNTVDHYRPGEVINYVSGGPHTRTVPTPVLCPNNVAPPLLNNDPECSLLITHGGHAIGVDNLPIKIRAPYIAMLPPNKIPMSTNINSIPGSEVVFSHLESANPFIQGKFGIQLGLELANYVVYYCDDPAPITAIQCQRAGFNLLTTDKTIALRFFRTMPATNEIVLPELTVYPLDYQMPPPPVTYPAAVGTFKSLQPFYKLGHGFAYIAYEGTEDKAAICANPPCTLDNSYVSETRLIYLCYKVASMSSAPGIKVFDGLTIDKCPGNNNNDKSLPTEAAIIKFIGRIRRYVIADNRMKKLFPASVLPPVISVREDPMANNRYSSPNIVLQKLNVLCQDELAYLMALHLVDLHTAYKMVHPFVHLDSTTPDWTNGVALAISKILLEFVNPPVHPSHKGKVDTCFQPTITIQSYNDNDVATLPTYVRVAMAVYKLAQSGLVKSPMDFLNHFFPILHSRNSLQIKTPHDLFGDIPLTLELNKIIYTLNNNNNNLLMSKSNLRSLASSALKSIGTSLPIEPITDTFNQDGQPTIDELADEDTLSDHYMSITALNDQEYAELAISLDKWVTIKQKNMAMEVLLSTEELTATYQYALTYLDHVASIELSSAYPLCEQIADDGTSTYQVCYPQTISSLTSIIEFIIRSPSTVTQTHGDMVYYFSPKADQTLPALLPTQYDGLVIATLNSKICDVLPISNVNFQGLATATSESLCEQAGPIISSVSKQTGSSVGGQKITIYGTSFNADHVVAIGETLCSQTTYLVLSSGDRALECTVPPGVGSHHQVYIVTADGSYVQDSVFLFSYDSPSISSVSYASGLTHIVGKNFGNPTIISADTDYAIDVSLDGVDCPITQFDDSNIACNSQYMYGDRLVQVTVGNSVFSTTTKLQATLLNQTQVTFTNNAPVITSLRPSQSQAGDVIQVIGSGLIGSDLSQAYSLIESSKVATLGDSFSTEATVQVPLYSQYASSPLLMQVENTVSNIITFNLRAPSITSFTPNQLPTTGGVLLITGSGFGMVPEALDFVHLGPYSLICTPFLKFIECTVPPGVGASLTLTVSVSGQTATTTSTFSFNAPTITNVQVNVADSILMIDGSNFIQPPTTVSSQDTFVTLTSSVLGETLTCTSPNFVSQSQITCTVNNFIDLSTVQVSIGGQLSNVWTLTTSLQGTIIIVDNTNTQVGTVSDVNLVLTKSGSSTPLTTTSSSSGSYSFPNILPGTYTMTITSNNPSIMLPLTTINVVVQVPSTTKNIYGLNKVSDCNGVLNSGSNTLNVQLGTLYLDDFGWCSSTGSCAMKVSSETLPQGCVATYLPNNVVTITARLVANVKVYLDSQITGVASATPYTNVQVVANQVTYAVDATTGIAAVTLPLGNSMIHIKTLDNNFISLINDVTVSMSLATPVIDLSFGVYEYKWYATHPPVVFTRPQSTSTLSLPIGSWLESFLNNLGWSAKTIISDVPPPMYDIEVYRGSQPFINIVDLYMFSNLPSKMVCRGQTISVPNRYPVNPPTIHLSVPDKSVIVGCSVDAGGLTLSCRFPGPLDTTSQEHEIMLIWRGRIPVLSRNYYYSYTRSSIQGQVYVDANTNGVYDSGETLLQGVPVTLNPLNLKTTTSNTGVYEFNYDAGTTPVTSFSISVDMSAFTQYYDPLSSHGLSSTACGTTLNIPVLNTGPSACQVTLKSGTNTLSIRTPLIDLTPYGWCATGGTCSNPITSIDNPSTCAPSLATNNMFSLIPGTPYSFKFITDQFLTGNAANTLPALDVTSNIKITISTTTPSPANVKYSFIYSPIGNTLNFNLPVGSTVVSIVSLVPSLVPLLNDARISVDTAAQPVVELPLRFYTWDYDANHGPAKLYENKLYEGQYLALPLGPIDSRAITNLLGTIDGAIRLPPGVRISMSSSCNSGGYYGFPVMYDIGGDVNLFREKFCAKPFDVFYYYTMDLTDANMFDNVQPSCLGSTFILPNRYINYVPELKLDGYSGPTVPCIPDATGKTLTCTFAPNIGSHSANIHLNGDSLYKFYHFSYPDVTMKGSAFLDLNQNNKQDAGEPFYTEKIGVNILTTSVNRTWVFPAGFVQLSLGTVYTLSILNSSFPVTLSGYAGTYIASQPVRQVYITRAMGCSATIPVALVKVSSNGCLSKLSSGTSNVLQVQYGATNLSQYGWCPSQQKCDYPITDSIVPTHCTQSFTSSSVINIGYNCRFRNFDYSSLSGVTYSINEYSNVIYYYSLCGPTPTQCAGLSTTKDISLCQLHLADYYPVGQQSANTWDINRSGYKLTTSAKSNINITRQGLVSVACGPTTKVTKAAEPVGLSYVINMESPLACAPSVSCEYNGLRFYDLSNTTLTINDVKEKTYNYTFSICYNPSFRCGTILGSQVASCQLVSQSSSGTVYVGNGDWSNAVWSSPEKDNYVGAKLTYDSPNDMCGTLKRNTKIHLMCGPDTTYSVVLGYENPAARCNYDMYVSTKLACPVVVPNCQFNGMDFSSIAKTEFTTTIPVKSYHQVCGTPPTCIKNLLGPFSSCTNSGTQWTATGTLSTGQWSLSNVVNGVMVNYKTTAASCPNQVRDTSIHLVCDTTTSTKSISQPSTCHIDIVMGSPLACPKPAPNCQFSTYDFSMLASTTFTQSGKDLAGTTVPFNFRVCGQAYGCVNTTGASVCVGKGTAWIDGGQEISGTWSKNAGTNTIDLKYTGEYNTDCPNYYPTTTIHFKCGTGATVATNAIETSKCQYDIQMSTPIVC
ncbi:hypothetical protein SAMD00019534_089450 [Acytostelium subglobosum LB1]|uniref:hypothetical protein n=1 Tax=Acytostelium subglobosum LB1 TaxID=1410327 RepID=UPI000644896A|nr:hypothetical protein SAMD00019534_089450 [Acytostelium subglobosum LB1]GAM25770.1 hypothetical protein SAMD00019534_089450 [Acytostelium subglobosum LB1]|eukprot:XP_012751288.1 hypothetical protein SAMD00019534_089450 [Acytostelium subglobosum LB1]